MFHFIIMDSSDLLVLARALHVVSLVIWIGGVAFVTLILIPAIFKIADIEDRYELFERLEGRFSLVARITTLLVMLSGVYLLEALSAWDRYLNPDYWWLHLMTLVWLIFTVVLFVLEPLFLHKWFALNARLNSDRVFARIRNMHWLLLILSLLAVIGGVMGSHGF